MKITRISSFIAASFTIGYLAGCASFAVSDSAIEDNTARTLGQDKSTIIISDRENDGVKSSYTATTRQGKRYSCYVTGTISGIGRVVSDAVCTPVGKPTGAAATPAGGSCNALLKAAGKC